MSEQVQISMGAMSDHINDQIERQGYKLDNQLKESVQKDADAITRLVLRELIPDSVAKKSRDKLFKRIMKNIREQS